MPAEPENPPRDAGPAAPDWRAALRRHAPWLRTVVLARVGEADAVADVMQQVALAAAQNASRVREPDKLAPWLYRVAVTAALQHRRALGRRRKLLDRYRGRVQQTGHNRAEEDPLEWLVANERRALVRRALASLGSRDAEVLLLKHTQDWSYSDLAQHLGVSEAAVEGRVHRARKRLRRALLSADPTLAGAERAEPTSGGSRLTGNAGMEGIGE